MQMMFSTIFTMGGPHYPKRLSPLKPSKMKLLLRALCEYTYPLTRPLLCTDRTCCAETSWVFPAKSYVNQVQRLAQTAEGAPTNGVDKNIFRIESSWIHMPHSEFINHYKKSCIGRCETTLCLSSISQQLFRWLHKHFAGNFRKTRGCRGI